MSQLVPEQGTPSPALLADIRGLIEGARNQTAVVVNTGLTLMYWHIGQRISAEVLAGERATYGEQIVATLSRQLSVDYGRSFGVKNLRHMMRFAESFPNSETVSALSRQLSWSHFLEIIYQKDTLKRDFYAEMCRIERWSVRTLRERMGSQLFERTAIAKQPDAVIRQELDALRITQSVSEKLLLKDPYILDFLGLQDRHLEKNLEDAILRELENFLLEMGAGFTFIARQKRIQIDNDDFYIDLLFYNRKLNRLVAIDLKLGDFRAEHKGQMELYLRWLAKHETEAGELPPLGIILCTGKKQEQIELLELDGAGIHVAEYLTVLPPPEVLRKKLHEAIATAQARIEAKGDEA
ncbi:MAG: DUF1016 domain-containing protein [Gallionella sp.]|nr:DUF1016 domain-containing protein [Gallionella sp.]